MAEHRSKRKVLGPPVAHGQIRRDPQGTRVICTGPTPAGRWLVTRDPLTLPTSLLSEETIRECYPEVLPA